MDKKRMLVILLMLLLVGLLTAVIFSGFKTEPETMDIKEEIAIADVPPTVIAKEKPVTVKVEPVIIKKEAKPLQIAEAPVARKQYVEKKIWQGNKGYIVKDFEYVYFGTYTIVTEEVAA